MITLKDITFEMFKDRIFDELTSNGCWEVDKIISDAPLVNLYLDVKDGEDLDRVVLYTKKSIKSKRLSCIIIRRAIKHLISGNIDFEISMDTLLTVLNYKGGSYSQPICNQKDIIKLASSTKLTQKQYMDNIESLSKYYDILKKKNTDLNSSDIELVHNLEQIDTSLKTSKKDRISRNKGYFYLYGNSYSKNDLISSPTSFEWVWFAENNPDIFSDGKIVEKLTLEQLERLISCIVNVLPKTRDIIINYLSVSDVFNEYTESLYNDSTFVRNQNGRILLANGARSISSYSASIYIKLLTLYREKNEIKDRDFVDKILNIIEYSYERTTISGISSKDFATFYDEKNIEMVLYVIDCVNNSHEYLIPSLIVSLLKKFCK